MKEEFYKLLFAGETGISPGWRAMGSRKFGNRYNQTAASDVREKSKGLATPPAPVKLV